MLSTAIAAHRAASRRCLLVSIALACLLLPPPPARAQQSASPNLELPEVVVSRPPSRARQLALPSTRRVRLRRHSSPLPRPTPRSSTARLRYRPRPAISRARSLSSPPRISSASSDAPCHTRSPTFPTSTSCRAVCPAVRPPCSCAKPIRTRSRFSSRINSSVQTAPGYSLVNAAANDAVNQCTTVLGRIDNTLNQHYQNPTGSSAPRSASTAGSGLPVDNGA